MILVGDIGGTRTRLAAFQTEGSRLECVVQKSYPSHEHDGLPEILPHFVRGQGIPVHSACFAVAGPVRDGRSKISNLTWTIDSRELATQLRLDKVGLLNDMEAYAYGIDALESKDFIAVSEGSEDAEGNRAVISARTGLGMAGLYWDGFRHHPFACEGGHADFAPRNDVEMQLLSYLQKKHGRISYERILSGPGIRNIYEFLRDTKVAEEPVGLKDEIAASHDVSATIANAAAAGRAAICEKTMEIFVSVFGAETGNCALRYMTTGGIFIGGIIAVKNVESMKAPAFIQAFLDKGRMGSLLKDMPVKIILNDDCGLIGAARYTLVQKAFRK
ncbi:MAG TPA: glucokinase [Candidatus Sulfotelmatobacter sp.]|jgi:glucokinase|nr:glucokinase [Candidatus Sulfotelmatobacter sp.]